MILLSASLISKCTVFTVVGTNNVVYFLVTKAFAHTVESGTCKKVLQ